MFLLNSVLIPAFAQTLVPVARGVALPVPGAMLSFSEKSSPAVIKGVTINPSEPLTFDFIVTEGPLDGKNSKQNFSKEARKLVNYFFAALTVPEDQMWVNLSPAEKDRIVPKDFGQTEMGRDMLAQDYILKQLTASLMYPESETGKRFWERIYSQTRQEFHAADIPLDAFNKVWIVPQTAVVYENGNSVFVVDARLKVMMEEEYLQQNQGQSSSNAAEIIKQVIIPQIEKEVNEGAHFAQLRQIYSAVILAAWYKKTLRDGLLGKIYTDQNKIDGIDIEDKQSYRKIYDQYLKAFQKGVYDYIKEEYDPATKQMVPRKYFSGGTAMPVLKNNLLKEADSAMAADSGLAAELKAARHVKVNLTARREKPEAESIDEAMTVLTVKFHDKEVSALAAFKALSALEEDIQEGNAEENPLGLAGLIGNKTRKISLQNFTKSMRGIGLSRREKLFTKRAVILELIAPFLEDAWTEVKFDIKDVEGQKNFYLVWSSLKKRNLPGVVTKIRRWILLQKKDVSEMLSKKAEKKFYNDNKKLIGEGYSQYLPEEGLTKHVYEGIRKKNSLDRTFDSFVIFEKGYRINRSARGILTLYQKGGYRQVTAVKVAKKFYGDKGMGYSEYDPKINTTTHYYSGVGRKGWGEFISEFTITEPNVYVDRIESEILEMLERGSRGKVVVEKEDEAMTVQKAVILEQFMEDKPLIEMLRWMHPDPEHVFSGSNLISLVDDEEYSLEIPLTKDGIIDIRFYGKLAENYGKKVLKVQVDPGIYKEAGSAQDAWEPLQEVILKAFGVVLDKKAESLDQTEELYKSVIGPVKVVSVYHKNMDTTTHSWNGIWKDGVWLLKKGEHERPGRHLYERAEAIIRQWGYRGDDPMAVMLLNPEMMRIKKAQKIMNRGYLYVFEGGWRLSFFKGLAGQDVTTINLRRGKTLWTAEVRKNIDEKNWEEALGVIKEKYASDSKNVAGKLLGLKSGSLELVESESFFPNVRSQRHYFQNGWTLDIAEGGMDVGKDIFLRSPAQDWIAYGVQSFPPHNWKKALDIMAKTYPDLKEVLAESPFGPISDKDRKSLQAMDYLYEDIENKFFASRNPLKRKELKKRLDAIKEEYEAILDKKYALLDRNAMEEFQKKFYDYYLSGGWQLRISPGVNKTYDIMLINGGYIWKVYGLKDINWKVYSLDDINLQSWIRLLVEKIQEEYLAALYVFPRVKDLHHADFEIYGPQSAAHYFQEDVSLRIEKRLSEEGFDLILRNGNVQWNSIVDYDGFDITDWRTAINILEKEHDLARRDQAIVSESQDIDEAEYEAQDAFWDVAIQNVLNGYGMTGGPLMVNSIKGYLNGEMGDVGLNLAASELVSIAGGELNLFEAIDILQSVEEEVFYPDAEEEYDDGEGREKGDQALLAESEGQMAKGRKQIADEVDHALSSQLLAISPTPDVGGIDFAQTVDSNTRRINAFPDNTVGGIDFNAEKINLEIQKGVSADPAVMDSQASDFAGIQEFIPVIVNISGVADATPLLGF